MNKADLYIEKINDLPVLPEISQKIIDLTDAPDPNVNEISALIQADPSITARILKMINSGYFSLRKEVISVRQAVILLGLSQIRNLVVTMLTVNHFKDRSGAQIVLSDFWNHSLAVATMAQNLGEKFGFEKPGDLYLSGLLHDIGKIIIQTYYPKDMERIIQYVDEHRCSLFEAECHLLGFSHAEIGGCLARKWKFPPRIYSAIAFHHNCQTAKDQFFTAILEFADQLTKARLFAIHGDQYFDIIIDDLPSWKIIQAHLKGQQDIDVERLLLEMDDEVEKARELVRTTRGA